MTPKISDAEKEKRRRIIIDSAKEVFTTKGYVPSTMQDIVDQTCMSRGWVYLYFSSKEEIMQAILAENAIETDVQLKNLINSGLSVWQGLCTLIDIMEQQLNDPSDELLIVNYEYFISGWKDNNRRNLLEAHYLTQHESLFNFLQRGVQNGEFKPRVDLDVINKMITSYFEGILLHTKAAGSNNVRLKEQLTLFKSILKEVLQVNDSKGE